MFRRLLFFCILVFLSKTGRCNHLVGGDMSYECLGNNKYEITLYIYHDNLSGGATLDNTATIGVFNKDNNTFNYYSFNLLSSRQVVNNSLGPCVNNPPPVDIERGLYRGTITIPPNTNGYSIVYQRCCRNSSILNLFDAGNQGSTYEIILTRAAMLGCNTQPQFVNYPPTLVCLDEVINFDHSASDVDGDSLVYSLCTPFQGASAADPNPAVYPNPPYQFVTYQSPYTALNPLNTIPPLKIDSKTGLLTFQPKTIGRFVVGICVSEYRNGVLLSTYARDFQFNAADCNATRADLTVTNGSSTTTGGVTFIGYCQGLSVKFENKSVGNFTNNWDFGIDTSSRDTSNIKSPTFTFPDTGTFQITLIINRGQICADTAYSILRITPGMVANFGYLAGCAREKVLFSDSSFSALNDVNSWKWTFGNGQTSTAQNPSITYNTGGMYNVVLVGATAQGCKDTARATIEVFPHPKSDFTANDVCVNQNVQFLDNSTIATGSIASHFWDLGNGLTSSSDDPNTIYNTTGPKDIMLVTTSDKNCKDTLIDQIMVLDTIAPGFEIQQGPYCTGSSYQFTDTSKGKIDSYKWDFGDNTTSSDKSPLHVFLDPGPYTITLEVSNNECGTWTVKKNITVSFTPYFDLPTKLVTCFGQYVQLTVIDSVGTNITWSTGSKKGSVFVDPSTPVVSVVVDRNGCKRADSTIIELLCDVYVPTAFSPNGDGHNDIFNLIDDNIASFSLSIYNRWNMLIYQTSDIHKGWNGVYKDKLQPVDDYMYFVEGVKVDGYSFEKKGTFTLIR